MKNNVKKGLVLTACLSMLVTGFAGCGNKAAETKEADTTAQTEAAKDMGTEAAAKPTESESKEPVTITALLMQSRNYDGLQQMIQKLKTEENITIDVQVVPDDQYQTLMKSKVNSGEAPDIIDYNIPGVYYELDPQQYLVDLSGEDWTKDLVAAKNVEYSDGKIYGYPFQYVQGVLGFVYNKDVFDKLGLKEPTSWDELLKVCETIKEKDKDVTPIFLPKDTWVPQIYMTANFATALGAEKAKETAKKLESNQMKWADVPEFSQVLDKYLDLFKKGYINTDFTSVNYDKAIEAVGTGEAAMIYCGDFFANSVKEAYPDAKLGMFNVNMIGNSDTIAATTQSVGFVVSKTSKNIDTVKKVFKLWSTPEYGNLYFKDRPGFPALKTIDGGATPDYMQSIKDKYITADKTVEEFNSAMTVGQNVVGSNLWLYYIDAPAKGNMDGKEILTKFQDDFDKYMKEMKQPGF